MPLRLPTSARPRAATAASAVALLALVGSARSVADDATRPADARPSALGLVQASALSLTGTGIRHEFAGHVPFFNLLVDVPAREAAEPEIGGYFRVDSRIGGAKTLDAYKLALATSCTAWPGSASCWGLNTVVNLQPGARRDTSLVGHEIDVNNTARDCRGPPTFPYCVGLVITGAVTPYTNQAAIDIEGASPLWNYGIYLNSPLGTAPETSSVRTASIFDATGSRTVLASNGPHVHGIDLREARFAETAFASRGFSVDPDGAVSATEIAAERVAATGMLLVPVSAPASARAPCRPGQFSFDSAYLYMCVAADTWHRAANGATW